MRQAISFIFGALFSMFIAQNSAAAIDTYQFADDAQKDRFYHLVDELRCPKCQNQALADSDAPIATDLRAAIYRLINEGKSDDEIKAYLVERYGEYILYRPQWSKQTWLLWLAPAILLGIGLAIVLAMVRRSRLVKQQVNNAVLSESEQQRVEQLLNRASKPKDES